MKFYKKSLILFLSTVVILPLFAYADTDSEIETIVQDIFPCETQATECILKQELVRELVNRLYAVLLEKAGELSVPTDTGKSFDFTEFQENPELRPGRSKRFFVTSRGVIESTEGAHPVYQEVIRLVDELLTQEHKEIFESIYFVNEPNSEYSARVEQIITSGGRNGEREDWEMYINLAQISLEDRNQYNRSLQILVHEVGHVYITNQTQLDFFAAESRCKTFYIDSLKSCAKDGSYLDVFTDFWSDEDMDWFERFEENYRNASIQRNESLTDYYFTNRSSFVTRYSATNPQEDIAETIAVFVMNNRPANIDTIANEKILSLYKFQEMVELRNRAQPLIK